MSSIPWSPCKKRRRKWIPQPPPEAVSNTPTHPMQYQLINELDHKVRAIFVIVKPITGNKIHVNQPLYFQSKPPKFKTYEYRIFSSPWLAYQVCLISMNPPLALFNCYLAGQRLVEIKKNASHSFEAWEEETKVMNRRDQLWSPNSKLVTTQPFIGQVCCLLT